MVLDALSAVSLAATIIQFVDFSSKIVSKGYHLYESADGVLSENARLGYVIADLKSLNTRLQKHEKLGCLTKEEQALKSVWNKKALDEMAATLSEYRNQIELHILLSLR
jgi:hypothetical protein